NANDVNAKVSRMTLPRLRRRTMMYDEKVDSTMPMVAPASARNTLFWNATRVRRSPMMDCQWVAVSIDHACCPGAITYGMTETYASTSTGMTTSTPPTRSVMSP